MYDMFIWPNISLKYELRNKIKIAKHKELKVKNIFNSSLPAKSNKVFLHINIHSR